MANETQTTQTAANAEPTQSADANTPVTDAKATIKIEGQSFELDSALAQDDKTLTVVLQPHFASIENANITREVKDGKLTVTIVKKAQHKGYK
ncbi:MAG: hypothetical protein KF756_06170 [Acidobacteria bacterium]|nr:hypothetical protein [Acidobacteriota bacterium]